MLADGRVSGAEMYRAIGAVPGEPPAIVNVAANDPPILRELARYPEPLLKVIDFTETVEEGGHAVSFSIYLTPNRWESGWGEVHRLRIEVGNERYDAWSDRTSFFRTARLRSIKFQGIEI